MNQTNPELLEQLRDLHLPEAVGWWPLAPGWWVVAAILLAILAAVLFTLVRHIYQRASTDSSTKYLDKLYNQCAASGTAAIYYDRVLTTLKHNAMQSAGSAHVAKLSGNCWVDWMEQATNDRFGASTRAALTTWCYQRDQSLPDRRSHDEICRWISRIKKKQSTTHSNLGWRHNIPGINRA